MHKLLYLKKITEHYLKELLLKDNIDLSDRPNQVIIKELNELIEFLDYSAKMKKNHMGVIKRWLNQAILEDILPKNPALYVTLPKVVHADRH